MGIRLDWEIEAEQDRRQQSAGEDPDAKRKRRRARLRFFLVLFIMLGLVGGAVGAVVLRLRQVDWEVEQQLRDTAAAEVAALRIGDRTAYLNIQRSATDDWLQQQDANFARYQALKQSADVNLSGRVIDSAVDGARGRVQIEEIIDGVPYGHAWFYWRYEDGWRHVPPDYTFWGNPDTIEATGVTVRYQAVDEAVAQAVAASVSGWLQTGCGALGCSLPPVVVEILPNRTLQIGWSDAGTLQLPSPYATVARLDTPFDADMQMKAATALADHMVGSFNAVYPTDAYYLRQAMVSWLVKRFAQVETNSFLVSSLANQYGEASVGRLLSALQVNPAANVGVIAGVTGTSLDAANLDWRDFLTWRLSVENELNSARDQANFLALYDTSDEAARQQALARYTSGAITGAPTVVSVIAERDSAGTPVLRAVVQIGDQQQDVNFRLVEGEWKRAS